MKNRLGTLFLTLVLLIAVLSQGALAATAQTITLVTNGGKSTYSPGYVIAAAGFVNTGTIAERNTDVFIQILNSSGTPVYFNSTTTDDTGFYMTVFTAPTSLGYEEYTIKASTSQAYATRTFTIVESSTITTTPVSLQGSFPQASTTTSPTTTIPLDTNTLVLAFSANVNFFFNKNASDWSNVNTIIGENENNEDCISVYEGSSTTPMSSSVALVSDQKTAAINQSYYDLSGELFTNGSTKQNCLTVTLNDALKSNTLYTVKINGQVSANNGSELGKDTYLYFKTPATTVTPTQSGGNVSTGSSTTSAQTGEAITKATVDSSGKAAASFTADQITTAITDAAEKAAVQGTGTKTAVKITVETATNPKSVDASIPSASMDQLVSSGVQSVTVASNLATITFDKSSLGTLAAGTNDVTVSAKTLDTSTLTADVQKAVGDRPVYNFSVSSGGNAITQFGGNVSVSIPYTPAAGEDTNSIIIYYLKADGTIETVPSGSYNPATGTVTFTTSHFSTYAVGYNKVTFADVPDSAWYGKAVAFIAARGITTGTSSNAFTPDASITRGQFIVMLMRAYGISPDTAPTDNFADAGNTYYTNYIAAAKQLGITNGTGNNMFSPDSSISRQDMFTQLYRALDSLGQLPSSTAGAKLSSYSDSVSISAYAQEAMQAFVSSGIVSGSDGKLDPTGISNRAQMAQVLYNLLT